MIEKTWEEFRQTGLLLFVNTFLHIFGWAIVADIENDKVLKVYPCRVSFRGFKEASVDEAYVKLTQYMKDNSEELFNEVKDQNDS